MFADSKTKTKHVSLDRFTYHTKVSSRKALGSLEIFRATHICTCDLHIYRKSANHTTTAYRLFSTLHNLFSSGSTRCRTSFSSDTSFLGFLMIFQVWLLCFCLFTSLRRLSRHNPLQGKLLSDMIIWEETLQFKQLLKYHLSAKPILETRTT